MLHLQDLAAHRRAIANDHGLSNVAETKAPNRFFLSCGATDQASHERQLKRFRHTSPFHRGNYSAFATILSKRSCFKPSRVARTALFAFRVPTHFVKMSLTPTDSRTARTAPPAITPVPGAAGRMITFAAPKVPTTSWGMVRPSISLTLRNDFLALRLALPIASGTSPAFPVPKPTSPDLLPTTTSAANENRRPPLTTFATRLIATTRSSNSDGFCCLGSTSTP